MQGNRRNKAPLWRAGLFLSLALISLLGLGAVEARFDYRTRGIEPGLPRPIAHSGVELGLNVALGQYEGQALDSALQRISSAGVRSVKQSFYYDDDYDWSASDRLVEALSRHDLHLVPLLDGDPSRAFAPPQNPERFGEWAGEFARRYGQQIRYYIIWDEPNLASHWGEQPVNPAEYAALLSATAETLRAVDSDAVVVAAPLAPTTERGPDNLADPLYLESLYEAGAAGAFDLAAAKPYGFYSGPDDRDVDMDTLNFSRAILLREVMVRNGDEDKALIAGNWGWNSLPDDWSGDPSLWGQTDARTQAEYTIKALARARQEWTWMGLMFLEAWQPDVAADNPRLGFTVAGRPLEEALSAELPPPDLAYPGFHPANEEGVGQEYGGEWRFSPQYGADVGQTGDSVTLRFWGTAAGLRVRRADYRARFYVTVDGDPANALPDDGEGTALVLTSPAPDDEFLSIETVVEGLEPGRHTLSVVAHRGWDQWALNGFSVDYRPDDTVYRLSTVGLALLAALFFLAAVNDVRHLPREVLDRPLRDFFGTLSERSRLLLTALMAGIVGLSGWLTWGEQAAGIYRRLGDVGQLALTAVAASIFYVTPFFFLYLAALLLLFLLIYARPVWGLALVAFTFPLYVVPKPMLGYRFSPVEVYLAITFVATVAGGLTHLLKEVQEPLESGGRQQVRILILHLRQIAHRVRSGLNGADFAVLAFVAVATLSLFFTERLDVAENEWRAVIVEPALFYLLLRALRPKKSEMWKILDAFVLGAVTVALYGLWKYALGENVITVSGGLFRLRSIYGSPNNVALYLGRIVPFALAMALMGGTTPRRRLAYGLALIPLAAAIALTLSKGAFFLGMPAAILAVFVVWRLGSGRPIWPWILAGALTILLLLLIALSQPTLSSRLNIQGVTSFARVNLWRSTVRMFADHPLFGVGLDNFLYAYRGRYILDQAWAEPNLNHPHNIVLDFATRLGLMGVLAGAWLFYSLGRTLWRLPTQAPRKWRPVAVGIVGALAQMVAHGLVDHSFFLVDLAFAFFFMLALATWLRQRSSVT